jgi:hypothetical protein
MVGGEILIKMGKRKKFLEAAIAIIVVTALILPSSTAMAYSPIKPSEKQKTLTVWMRGVNGQDYSIKMNVSQEKLEELTVALNDFLAFTNTTMNETSPEGINISVSEWKEIENGFSHMIDLIKEVAGDDFPVEAIKTYLGSIIEALRGPFSIIRQPLLSIGIGFTLVPFYDYETFLGKFLRPVFMRHFIGFSATCRLNPFLLGFPYWYFGYQRVRTFLFTGLLINFGDLGINRYIGPQLLLGYGCITGIISPGFIHH